jgi:hypothetical protein
MRRCIIRLMKRLSKYFFLFGVLFLALPALGQHTPTDENEADPEEETDVILEEGGPVKILHAEPLYIDLIRDLGARKGEREWNVGMGMTDRLHYDSYEFLVEYEWAIIDRLGLEVEVPMTIYTRLPNRNGPSSPSNRIESLKLAAQYTFLVAPKIKTSMAIGGITEFEFTDLNRIRPENAFRGILYNPFFIAAKVWGSNFHTLVYTGPRITTHFHGGPADFAYEINTNFHYMIPGTRNFIGVEFNKLHSFGTFDMVIRPQMRLVIKDNLMLGIVPGIPINRANERLSSFFRLIYEPRGTH